MDKSCASAMAMIAALTCLLTRPSSAAIRAMEFWPPTTASDTIADDGCCMSTRPPRRGRGHALRRMLQVDFSHRISVEHLLRFVEGMIDDGPGWLAAFDPETLEPVPTERIDDTLHRHLSDLIWRVRLRDGGDDDWAISSC